MQSVADRLSIGTSDAGDGTAHFFNVSSESRRFLTGRTSATSSTDYTANRAQDTSDAIAYGGCNGSDAAGDARSLVVTNSHCFRYFDCEAISIEIRNGL